MFKFVLGHSKAWLFYNRFLLCLKSVHIEKTAQLRFRFVSLFGVRQTRLSPPASRQINLTPLHSSSILFFSLVSKSFKVISLFSYQGCLLFSLQATTSIYYQSQLLLSRTFLNYFLLCLPTFFSVVRDSLFILSRGFSFVNMFFQFFIILCNSSAMAALLQLYITA